MRVCARGAGPGPLMSVRTTEFSSASERVAWEKFQRQKHSEEARRAAGPAVTDTSVNSTVHGGRLDGPLHAGSDLTPPEFASRARSVSVSVCVCLSVCVHRETVCVCGGESMD